jgi:hypothetical protein
VIRRLFEPDDFRALYAIKEACFEPAVPRNRHPISGHEPTSAERSFADRISEPGFQGAGTPTDACQFGVRLPKDTYRTMRPLCSANFV